MGTTDDTSAVLITALRLFLRASSPDAVVAAMTDAVRALGGDVAPAADRPQGSVPIDISFGVGEPVLPTAVGPAHGVLERILPGLVEDGRVAVARIHRAAYLQASATSDPLTGLTNRRVAMRVLNRLSFGDTVMFVDLDFFKKVNDTFGHEAGDDVLRGFGRSLQMVARAGDTVGRLGGEEFLLLLPRTGIEGALAVTARLRTHWEATRLHPVTFSAGMVTVGAEGGISALREADQALYRAKRAGRDRVEVAR